MMVRIRSKGTSNNSASNARRESGPSGAERDRTSRVSQHTVDTVQHDLARACPGAITVNGQLTEKIESFHSRLKSRRRVGVVSLQPQRDITRTLLQCSGKLVPTHVKQCSRFQALFHQLVVHGIKTRT